MEGDTLIVATPSITEYVKGLVAQGRDLRVCLTWALLVLREFSEQRFPYACDAVELRSSKFDDFEDLELWFQEHAKMRNPVERTRRELEKGGGGE